VGKSAERQKKEKSENVKPQNEKPNNEKEETQTEQPEDGEVKDEAAEELNEAADEEAGEVLEQSEKVEEIQQDNEEIKKLTDELQRGKDAYLRMAAEYDNYRKRSQAEKRNIYEDATSSVISELLPVADSLYSALQGLKEDAPEEFKKGLELIKNQILNCFAKLKVDSFGDVGDDFDPGLHNAISKIGNEEFEKNKISMVFQRGYKTSNKIIRYAMVQVANCD